MVITKRYGKYCLEEDRREFAAFSDLATVAIVCRFIKGGRLEPKEYSAALEAMKSYDAAKSGQEGTA